MGNARRHELAGGVAAHRDLVRAAVAHREPDGLELARPRQRRHQDEFHLVAGNEVAFSERAARRFDHAARQPGLGSERLHQLGQRIAAAGLHLAHFTAFDVVGRIVGFDHGLGEHGCIRRHHLLLGRLVSEPAARQIEPLGQEARPHGGLLALCLLRPLHDLDDVLQIQLLPILGGQDAAEQLDDAHGHLAAREPAALAVLVGSLSHGRVVGV